MKSVITEKRLPWTKKDVFKVLAVYLLNILLLSILFLMGIAINGNGVDALKTFFSKPQKFLSFEILLIFALGFMALYFIYEDKDFLHDASNSEMIFLIMEVSLILNFVFDKYVHSFSLPFALVALLTLFLTDTRKSVFINIVFSFVFLICFNFINPLFANQSVNGYLLFMLIMSFCSGIVATYLMSNVYSRSKLLLRSIIVSLPVVASVGLLLLIGYQADLVKIFVASGCTGPLSVAIFVVLLPVFESLFKKVSCFKFAELTDHNSKLIKKMIEQAPGTFNHSIIVSNIAEACATAIGEDALLARTCAYYHDIGKLRRPEFFKENQGGGESAHDEITPELSVNIIKAHTQDGYNLLIKNRISEKVADVCLQHHGTTPIVYFYDKAKKFTDGDVDISQFCYSGPKPRTKIAAIMMIADSAEAATRTLADRSAENVTKVVRGIVSDKMKLGQFEECEITLKELNIIIYTVINTLTGVYHSRVEYPKVTLEGIESDKN